METSYRLSIIIPIFNLETYIRKCIDSILGYEELCLEVLLIDDGSTDASPKLCDEYAARYPFIKVIHKKNEGAATARNTGMRAAKGTYLMFLDGDDFLADQVLKDIVSYLDGETELFTFHFFDYYEEENIRKKVPHLSTPELYDTRGNITKDIFYSVPALPMPWLYLLKREFVLQNDLFMRAGLLDEDEEWSARVYANLRKAKVIELYAYCYRRNRANSLTYGRQYANLMADLDIVELLEQEAAKEIYDIRQKHILYNKCRQLFVKIIDENTLQIPKHKKVINKRLKQLRSILLGGSKAEKVMYLLSFLCGFKNAKELIKKIVGLKSIKKP